MGQEKERKAEMTREEINALLRECRQDITDALEEHGPALTVQVLRALADMIEAESKKVN